jgi:hypothetical protein
MVANYLELGPELGPQEFTVTFAVNRLNTNIATVIFCFMSPVQLPNNSGARPGTSMGTAREIFHDQNKFS